MSYAEALKKGIPHHCRRSDDSNSMSDQYFRHNQNTAVNTTRIKVPGILLRARIILKDIIGETLHKNHHKIRGILLKDNAGYKRSGKKLLTV